MAADNQCCPNKVVPGSMEKSGTYSLLDQRDMQDLPNYCMDGCVYKKGDSPDSFCFKPSSEYTAECSTDLPEGWKEAWSTVVPSILPSAPQEKLWVSWGDSMESMMPGEFVSTGDMLSRPGMSWRAEEEELYTILILDAGIKELLPKMYVHWMMMNIKGKVGLKNSKDGDEAMQYVPPFSMELNEDLTFITDPLKASHTMLMLVYKQTTGLLTNITDAQKGCTTDIVNSRLFDPKVLEERYGLELVAGNLLKAPYSQGHTEDAMCRMSKCVREPWPFPMAGVNDRQECRATTEVLDITIRGPKLELKEEYAKYSSVLSPQSITTLINNSYPAISSGKLKDFTGLKGSFETSWPGPGNMRETLEGVVDAALLAYQDVEAAKTVFTTFDFEGIETKLFPTVAGYIRILLSQPADLDFFDLLGRSGLVLDIMMVKAKEGREEEFLNLRGVFTKKAMTSRTVSSVTNFDVRNDILPKEGPLSFDATNNELMIKAFDTVEARDKDMAEISKDKQVEAFFDTFDCIVCATFTDEMWPEMYGPFQ